MPRATRRPHATALAFEALTVEGALIAPAMLARIADQKASGQADSDYNVPKGLTLRDDIARYFRIGQALFIELFAVATPSAAATTRFVESLLREVFGFGDINRAGLLKLGEHLYPVTLEARGGRVPVVVVPPMISTRRARICRARVAGGRPLPPCRIVSTRATARYEDCAATASNSASCVPTPA
jgi:hypothetical protein